MFTLRLDGRNRVKNRLRTMVRLFPRAADRGMKKGLEVIRRQMRGVPYPPQPTPPPGRRRYRRTGRLGSSWYKQRLAMAVWEIGNRAGANQGKIYAGYVIGDSEGRQAGHMGHWWVALQEVTRRLRILRLHVETELRHAARSSRG